MAQLEQLQAMDVDYAGLIFYEKSKRYAHEKLRTSAKEIRNLQIQKVGVFVNANIVFLKSCVAEYGLAAVQLHGDEPPAFCQMLQRETRVIKVFRMHDAVEDVDVQVEPYQDCSDYFLFDTDTAAYGGSGQRFDWTLLKNAAIGKPFFLSGGIGPADIGLLKKFSHPHLYAIDVNSRFETTPGVKNLDTVKIFVHALKQPLYG
jgi:phosphoribosylanthranilate isomerase